MENKGKVVHSQNVILNLDADNATQALVTLANRLYENGYVHESFAQAVLDREVVFPTGIATEEYGVALPHTDAHHVKTNTIAVGVLKKPVSFNMMGYDDEQVDVELIIMLAINEPNGHLEVLQKLSDILQSRELLKQIKHATDVTFIENTLNNVFVL